MALRLLLTTMVVSLSLPLSSVDSCRLLVGELNQELATVLDNIRDEWSPRTLKPLVAALSGELANLGAVPSLDLAVTEETFSRILDEFAIEATRPVIEPDANHARVLPLEQVNDPLPPAVEAIDALPSALELIRSVSEMHEALSVVSESPLWEEIVADRKTATEEIEFVIDMVHPVVSDDIGPWQWLEGDTSEQSRKSERIAQVAREAEVSVHAGDSISEASESVIRLAAVADSFPTIEFPAPASNQNETRNVTIQDAFRKTAEAIALWSKVLKRTF